MIMSFKSLRFELCSPPLFIGITKPYSDPQHHTTFYSVLKFHSPSPK